MAQHLSIELLLLKLSELGISEQNMNVLVDKLELLREASDEQYHDALQTAIEYFSSKNSDEIDIILKESMNKLLERHFPSEAYSNCAKINEWGWLNVENVWQSLRMIVKYSYFAGDIGLVKTYTEAFRENLLGYLLAGDPTYNTNDLLDRLSFECNQQAEQVGEMSTYFEEAKIIIARLER
jgi:hypothetical protein